jgi:hypothetical protein
MLMEQAFCKVLHEVLLCSVCRQHVQGRAGGQESVQYGGVMLQTEASRAVGLNSKTFKLTSCEDCECSEGNNRQHADAHLY